VASDADFNLKPTLENDDVLLRPLAPEDFDALYEAANDPLLWAGHPSKDRYQREVFESWFEDALKSETALVILDKKQNRVIGSTRFYYYRPEFSEVAIGYTFIARSHWGGAYNRYVKQLMLENAFQCVDTVWFHIDPANIRSQTATKKFGATYQHTAELEGVVYNWFKLPKGVWLSLMQ
jgi:RimJ/RimL family protein N-acetyltransferase